MRKLIAVLAAALSISAFPGFASAKELTVASWVAPSHPTISAGYSVYFPAVEKASGGEITFKLVSGGALMGGKETLQGLGDGIADASVLALTYNPAQLPTNQLVAELAMQSGNSLAVAAAVTEFTLLGCAPCIEEFKGQNVVYAGSYATAPYALISKTAINTLEDIKGKRVRSPGGAWDRWIEASGGVVVHTSSSEMYEAIDKGIIDVAMQPAAALKAFSLWDVAGKITLADLGVYNSGPLLAFNKDSWAGLDAEKRRVLLDEMAQAIVATTNGYTKLNEEALGEAASHNVTVNDKPDAMQQWIGKFNSEDASAIIKKAEEVYKIENAAELVNVYSDILSKWEAKLAGGMDDAALAEALKTEIFDKLEAENYGL